MGTPTAISLNPTPIGEPCFQTILCPGWQSHYPLVNAALDKKYDAKGDMITLIDVDGYYAHYVRNYFPPQDVPEPEDGDLVQGDCIRRGFRAEYAIDAFGRVHFLKDDRRVPAQDVMDRSKA